MTDEQVKNGFNEVYNRFWLKNKNHIPERDSEEWDRIHAEVNALRGKYPFLADTVIRMEVELDERMREEEKMIENSFSFMMAAGEGLKKGTQKDFVCPICGGKAHANMAASNGHIHASCEKCGRRVIQ